MNNTQLLDDPIPYEGSEKYIFISYSHKDKEEVYKDIKMLQHEGVRIWYDKGIYAGNKWDEFVYPKIVSKQCALVLFYVSEQFFYSPAIGKEIRIVFNTDGSEREIKESFSVNFDGKSAFSMLLNLSNRKKAINENTKLILEHFDENKIFIPRIKGENNHISDILAALVRYDVIDEAYKHKIKKRDRRYDVLMVGKDSTFTKSIKQGAQETFSSEGDFHFIPKLINTSDFKDSELELLKIIEDHKSMLDGILIRPIKNISKPLITSIENLIKNGKRVILLDKDLSKEQKKSFKTSLPFFLASNFTLGGYLIADRIKKTIINRGTDNYKIVILDGPNSILSATQRVNSLKKRLQQNNQDLNTTIFMIDSFNVESVISFLEHKFRYLYKKESLSVSSCDLMLYLGNDNIAKRVIEIYKSKSESYISKYINKARSVIFIGYDGIRNKDGKIDLLTHRVNAMTVDVQPGVQGTNAADIMIRLLTTSKYILNNAAPVLEENINMKPHRGKSIINIEEYLEGKKYIVFDLDGTIANTEDIHFKSYQRILEEYGIKFVFEDFKAYIGNNERKIWGMMSETFGLSYDIEEMVLLRTKIVLELFIEEDLQPFDYFYSLLEKYKNIEKVILSSQIPLVINFLLDKWGIKDIFTEEKIISVSNSTYKKGYVLANLSELYPCVKADYVPEEVVLFEDSDKTLKIAKDFNISTIGIEHKFNYHKLENCDYIINEEISSGLFIGLAGIDIVHYQNQKLPEEDSKSKTDDFEVYVGGPAANAAITFAQLGGDATLLSCVGNSEIGKALKGMLSSYGVTVIDALNDEFMTPNISSVIINKLNGNRTIISGQKKYNDKEFKLNTRLFSSFEFVMYDCNAPMLFESNLEQLNSMKLILDAGSYKPHVPKALKIAHEVISSKKFKEDELDILELKKKYNIDFVAKSNGEDPIDYKINDNTIGKINIKEVSKVVDTLGAGDALHGSYCYYRFQEKLPYVEALKKASEYASDSVTYRGIIKKDK